MAETTAYNVMADLIIQSPDVCGGEPCIAKHRIKVRHVYVWYEQLGMSPDEIADGWGLSLAEVHAALAYAQEHLDEIRQAIRGEEGVAGALKQNHLSKLQQKLHGDK